MNGTIPFERNRSITGKMFGVSGLIDIAVIRPLQTVSSSSNKLKSPGIVSAPAPGTMTR